MPGYDFAIQALSGLMSITGPVDGPPCKVGVAATDVLTGLYAAVAVLACLHARQRSGHGYAIDLSLLDCAVAVAGQRRPGVSDQRPGAGASGQRPPANRALSDVRDRRRLAGAGGRQRWPMAALLPRCRAPRSGGG